MARLSQTVVGMVFVIFLANQAWAQQGQADHSPSPSGLAAPFEWSPWTMSGSEIQTTGAVRLSELFRMMPSIETWGSDRYTLRLLGMGLDGQHGAQPVMVLDGVELPAFFLDRVLTEALPVAPGDLDGLVYQSELEMSDAGRLSAGKLRLSTPMITGWQASGAIAVINETGDPGPAKHSDARRDNVDRSGPATWLRLGWGDGIWLVQAGLQTDLHHLTDTRIAGRVRRTYSEDAQPIVTQFSPFVRIRKKGATTRLQVLAGHSRRKDFIFHEAAGWEWPARLQRSWAIAQASKDFKGFSLFVRADGSEGSLTDRPSFIALPPELEWREAAFSSSIMRSGPTWNARIGGSARTFEISQLADGTNTVNSRMLPGIHASIGARSDRWTFRTFANALLLDDDGLQSSSTSYVVGTESSRRGPQGGIDLGIRWQSGHVPEPGQLTEWTRAGVDLGEWMQLADLDAVSSHSFTPRTASMGLTVHRSFKGAWLGWLDGRIRWQDGQLLQDRVVTQPFGVGPLLPEWSWSGPHSGWLFSRSIGLERTAADRIVWRTFFQFHHVSSEGDDVFFRHQTGFSRHRAWVTASDERPGGFRWFTRIGYLSAWTWPEYQEPARRSIPGDLVVDATFGKTLMSGHLNAMVSVLNLPDRALGNHPAGVREQLAIRLSIAFSTHSDAASR